MSDWQITCGDCLGLLRSIPSGTVDAVITDPPYGVDWDTDYRRFSLGFDVERTNHKPVANDANPFDPSPWLTFPRVVMFGANCFSDRLPCGTWFIWDKRFQNGTAFLADGEAAWMNSGHGVYIKSVTSQGFVRPDPTQHPTQKPVEVMRWIIERATKPGDTVLDPYMGVGSTGVACLQTGRKFIGFEIDPGYCEIARRRLADVAPLFMPAPKEPEPELFQ